MSFNSKLFPTLFAVCGVIGLVRCDLWDNTTLAWTAQFKGTYSSALQLKGNIHTIIRRFSEGSFKSTGTYDFKATKEPRPKRIFHAIALDHPSIRTFISDLTKNTICYVENVTTEHCPFALPLSSHVYSISYDWITQQLYWADSYTGVIGMYSLTNDVWRVITAQGKPLSVVAAPTIGFLFWVEVGESDEDGDVGSFQWTRIVRSDMAGKEKKFIFEDNSTTPRDLQYDMITGKLFWLSTDFVHGSSVDGSDRVAYSGGKYQALFTSFVVAWPYIIFGTSKNLLVFSTQNHTKNLKFVTSITFQNYIKVKALAISSASLQPYISNACSLENGGCSHLCFVKEFVKVCKCGVGYELEEDGETCISAALSALPRKDTLLVLDGTGRLLRLDSSTGEQSFLPNIPFPVSFITYDSKTENLFFSSASFIYRLTLKAGGKPKRIYASSILDTVTGLGIQLSDDLLFFSTIQGQVNSIDFDGNHLKHIISASTLTLMNVHASNLYLHDGWTRKTWKIDVLVPNKRKLITQDFSVRSLDLISEDAFYFVTNDGVLVAVQYNNISFFTIILASNHTSALTSQSTLHPNTTTSHTPSVFARFESSSISKHTFYLSAIDTSHSYTNFTSVYHDGDSIYMTDQQNHCLWKVHNKTLKAVKLNNQPIYKPLYALLIRRTKDASSFSPRVFPPSTTSMSLLALLTTLHRCLFKHSLALR